MIGPGHAKQTRTERQRAPALDAGEFPGMDAIDAAREQCGQAVIGLDGRRRAGVSLIPEPQLRRQDPEEINRHGKPREDRTDKLDREAESISVERERLG